MSTGFALLAIVKPCKLATLTDHIRRCELHGIPMPPDDWTGHLSVSKPGRV